MMISTKENKSYQAILYHAKLLFWKHGVRRVSVEEICRVAGVSKMTFYRLFRNKNEAALTVLQNEHEKSLMQYRSIMDRQIPFSEKIKQIMLLKKESSTDISKEFISEIYQNEDIGLKQQIEKYRLIVKDEVFKNFKEAKKQGWIRQDLNIDFIMYMLDRLTQMVFDERLNNIYESSQEVIMEMSNFFFYGILPCESNNT